MINSFFIKFFSHDRHLKLFKKQHETWRKIKATCIALIFLISIMSTFVFGVSADIKSKDIENDATSNDDIIDIRVAIYTDEKEADPDFYEPYGRTIYFIRALSDYSWNVGNTCYKIITTLLTTKDILRGKLTVNNYDVLVYPPDTADQDMFITGVSILPRNIVRERNIAKFINNGGGYYGTCGGAMIAGDFKNEPDTFIEKLLKNSCLKISDVDMEVNTHMPLVAQLIGMPPESFGPMAYLCYSGWNMTDMNINYHGGACLDVNISKDHPIFGDLIENTRKIRWIGAPAFEIPDETDGEISVIARFPEEEISENETIDIHHWKYTGGIRGLIKGLLYRGGEIHWMENLGIAMKAFVFAGDWTIDKLVETNLSNKPFMVAEAYPNKNNARIVRCSGHPEHNVWWDGHIEEMEDTDYNNIYDAFHRWVGITPENETVEDEFAYNYWINRRSVAWASKRVPDSDLPPVYGPSQVRDFDSYNQTSSEFTIFGNAEVSDGIESLDLYYRYSGDNETFCPWAPYETDSDSSNGWSWGFNSPNGTGYYQFYSLRHVQFENEWLNETAPPGPDAILHIDAI